VTQLRKYNSDGPQHGPLSSADNDIGPVTTLLPTGGSSTLACLITCAAIIRTCGLHVCTRGLVKGGDGVCLRRMNVGHCLVISTHVNLLRPTRDTREHISVVSYNVLFAKSPSESVSAMFVDHRPLA
jgi:hypothetical protein